MRGCETADEQTSAFLGVHWPVRAPHITTNGAKPHAKPLPREVAAARWGANIAAPGGATTHQQRRLAWLVRSDRACGWRGTC